jgi:hypothetical protein
VHWKNSLDGLLYSFIGYICRYIMGIRNISRFSTLIKQSKKQSGKLDIQFDLSIVKKKNLTKYTLVIDSDCLWVGCEFKIMIFCSLDLQPWAYFVGRKGSFCQKTGVLWEALWCGIILQSLPWPRVCPPSVTLQCYQKVTCLAYSQSKWRWLVLRAILWWLKGNPINHFAL